MNVFCRDKFNKEDKYVNLMKFVGFSVLFSAICLVMEIVKETDRISEKSAMYQLISHVFISRISHLNSERPECGK